MRIQKDYYKILQVHYLAESEVIESAYRRLAKKYHPDVFKSPQSEMIMTQLNEAYEVLRDPDKRRRYNFEWAQFRDKPQGQNTLQDSLEENSRGAKQILRRYFKCLANSDYKEAYGLISTVDHSNIPCDDFLRWQACVSKIYRLEDFQCMACRHEMNVCLGGASAAEACDFVVITVEYNNVMGKREKDIFTKKVVREKEGWRVYIGHQSVLPHIEKFEKLSQLLTAKSMIGEIVNTYSNIDHSTGFLNKRGFIEAVDREAMRHERYGNAFSVILCEIKSGCSGQSKQRLIETAVRFLSRNFKDIDSVGRWGEQSFAILLPEIRINKAVSVAGKIKRTAEYANRRKNTEPFAVKIAVTEFSGTIENTFNKLTQLMQVANERDGTTIALETGIYQ